MIRKFVGIFFFALLIFSCINNHTSVLSIAEMKPIMWDMLNADNWNLQMSVLDTSTKGKKLSNVVLYNKIFKQYDITKEQFYLSYKYYELHPEQMKILIDSVEAYGTRQKLDLDKPIPTLKVKK